MLVQKRQRMSHRKRVAKRAEAQEGQKWVTTKTVVLAQQRERTPIAVAELVEVTPDQLLSLSVSYRRWQIKWRVKRRMRKWRQTRRKCAG